MFLSKSLYVKVNCLIKGSCFERYTSMTVAPSLTRRFHCSRGAAMFKKAVILPKLTSRFKNIAVPVLISHLFIIRAIKSRGNRWTGVCGTYVRE